ncbi:glycosyltransferase family 1 protein [Candidatus Parcubacteria bacterium]|nr:MAG: glycosyltransferase family 1 protein [Candidatus Parcubacteria bacterium]
MKKTLVLTHEYYPFKGGVARYVYNLFKNFDNKDYLVVTDHPDVRTENNIINIKLRHTFIWPSWLLAYFKLKKIIKKNNVEIIFTPNILPLGTMAYFLGLPYIVSLHGLDINLALKNKGWLTKLILSKAHSIVTNTKNTAKLIAHLNLPSKKIFVIYPSLDWGYKFYQDKFVKLQQTLGIREGEKVLLTVGRLNRRKGQDLVIRAIARLKREMDIKYLIVGQGDFEIELRQLINENDLEANVFIFKDVEDIDLIYYYKMADIFVLPNRETSVDIEGFGIVFLEAASFKLPIIAGASGGVTEILSNRENALLVKNGDLDQLTDHIKHLLKNKVDADKLAAKAYAKAQEFSSAKEQSNILKNILA